MANTIQERLEKLLKEGVDKSIKNIKRPYALFLSGGLDSSLLAALTKPDLLITCRFPYGKKYDEFNYASRVADYLGIKHEVIEFTEKDFRKHLPNAVKAHKPTTHFSLVPLWMLFKKASELGIKTVLSAEGPDEYLGGYSSYMFITHEQELYSIDELKNYRPALGKYLGTPMERFAKILHKEPKQLKPYWGKYKNLLSKMGYTDLNLRGIEEMEQDIAKFWDVDLLYPYMSKKVEKFCFENVPDDLKINGYITKFVLRMIADKYLPDSVVWRRSKMGGPVAPIGKWLGEKDEFCKDKYLKLQQKYAR